jgi:hypothetical protein
LALQGKSTTVLNVKDNVNAAIMKPDRWVTRLELHELDCFETLNNFVVVSGEELEPQVIDIMKEHLMELKSNLQLTFQTRTVTWNGFEIPLKLMILNYHQVKKRVLLTSSEIER